jgi:hypothetical protein
MARGQGPRQASPKRVGSLHHSDKRLNIPTAEMQSFFQREEDHSPLAPRHYRRVTSLPEGEQRERDPDRDPQILWNGIRITLTRLGQPDGISPSRMAEMLEVDKAGPIVRC